MSASLTGRSPAYPYEPPPTAPPAQVRLPLHDELYLLAHDEDTGTARIHTGSLAIGLAAAVLIDLLLDRHVSLWDGRIHVDTRHHHDPIASAAIAHLRAAPPLPYVKPWLRSFSDAGLYQRVRANLLAVGILRHQPRRLRADIYAPVHTVWAIRVRGHLRSVLTGHEQSDAQCAALCGLVDALGIHHHLAYSEPSNQIRHALQAVASLHLPPVRTVITATGDVVGDLATAVYR